MAISAEGLGEVLEDMKSEGAQGKDLENQLFALQKITYIEGVDGKVDNAEEMIADLLSQDKKLRKASILQGLYLASAIGPGKNK